MLELLERAVDDAVGPDPSTMCDSEIRESLTGLSRQMDRQSARVAVLLAVADHRKVHLGDGAPSMAAWMQAQCGQRYSDANALLRAGLACESLPLVAKAWAQGEISTSAARTIARGRKTGHEGVYAAMEETLVDYAAGRDFLGLDLLIRHYRVRADALDDKDPADANRYRLSPVGDRWALAGDLDQLAGQIADAALHAAMDKPSDGDDRSADQRRSDAFTRINRFFLDHAQLPVEGGEVPHVSVTVAWETLRDQTVPGPGESPFSPGQISQLLCEARINRIVFGPAGVPLDVGRSTRNPSQGLRRAVVARDRHCRFPGCGRPPGWSQVHHVDPWFPYGETKLGNLVLLCDFHHGLIHKPGWNLTFDGHTLTVTKPDGNPIGASP